jgi:hypothetical protein
MAMAAKKVAFPKIELHYAPTTVRSWTYEIRSHAAKSAGRPDERHGPSDVLGANGIGKEQAVRLGLQLNTRLFAALVLPTHAATPAGTEASLTSKPIYVETPAFFGREAPGVAWTT